MSKRDEYLAQFYSDEAITSHHNDISILTGTNIVGPNNGYTDGYTNKVYGMNFGTSPDNLLILDSAKEVQNYIKFADTDTYNFNIPSNGVPSWLTTVWANKIIEQVFQTTSFTKMAHSFQQGQFGTTNIKIPTISYGGNAEPYADMSGGGQNVVNINWVDRETITLQRTLTYGDLATAQMGMAKISYVSQLRAGLAKLIALDQNKIGFNGFAGVKCFGLLNDPSLNATVPCPASSGTPSSSQWIYKSYAEIVADIIALVNGVISIAGGQADVTDKCILGVPPAVYAYLDKQNSLGTQSVREYIKLAYSGMEIIQVQDYQGTGSPIGSSTANTIQLIWSKLVSQEVALNAFCSLYNSHGTVRKVSYFNEKISYTVAGAIVALPIGIATMTGV